MNIRKNLIPTVLAAIGVVGFAVGCSSTPGNDANRNDQAVSASILDGYQKSQPVPKKDWSQLRQNLIEIETAQADSTQTTSFLFNLGAGDPIMVCPSIGFPIPSTYQLTNPQQVVEKGQYANGSVSIPQIEANGVFTGDSTGTYVMCVNGNGKAYAMYWEGYVATAASGATWNAESKTIQLNGDPTAEFTEQR